MVIAFIGSVFSPYYARARHRALARGAAPPSAEQHVAFNVALYRPGQRGAWTMTERGATRLQRSADRLAIGPSAWQWQGDSLVLQLDERGLPWPLPSRVKGCIRLHPSAPGATPPLALDAHGQHQWWPVAPVSRVTVDLPEPGWRWQGQAYLDSNRGSVPLEQGFVRWQWARAALSPGRSSAASLACGAPAAVVYDTVRRDGSHQALALRFGGQGAGEPFEAPPRQPLPASGWRLPRDMWGRVAPQPRVLHTLQDAPFYARSLVQAHWLGQPVVALHESLDLDRFQHPLVQAMLRFRMPRRGG